MRNRREKATAMERRGDVGNDGPGGRGGGAQICLADRGDVSLMNPCENATHKGILGRMAARWGEGEDAEPFKRTRFMLFTGQTM